MPGRPARSSATSSPRLLLLDDGVHHDVFDVLEVSSDLIRVRSAFLLEVGEELTLQIEQDGTRVDATVRVRAHVGPETEQTTELEILERSEPEAVRA